MIRQNSSNKDAQKRKWFLCTVYHLLIYLALTHQATLHPPLTIIELQPACSAFSPKIKLPPYFEQYSKGFPAALKTANLAIPKFSPSSFRIWDAFNVSNITPVEIENLRNCHLPHPSLWPN